MYGQMSEINNYYYYYLDENIYDITLTLRINNRGPIIDPCGTPCVMFLMLDLIPL